MTNKGEISTFKAWLILLASLLDDAALVVLLFLGLHFFHVKITWLIILVVGLVVVLFFFIMHNAIMPGLRRRKMNGAEGMIGITGRVTQPLRPRGLVKVNGEYWTALATDGDTEVGEEVEIVGISGLVLKVKCKKL